LSARIGALPLECLDVFGVRGGESSRRLPLEVPSSSIVCGWCGSEGKRGCSSASMVLRHCANTESAVVRRTGRVARSSQLHSAGGCGRELEVAGQGLGVEMPGTGVGGAAGH
jgi:hypothetical protein